MEIPGKTHLKPLYPATNPLLLRPQPLERYLSTLTTNPTPNALRLSPASKASRSTRRISPSSSTPVISPNSTTGLQDSSQLLNWAILLVYLSWGISDGLILMPLKPAIALGHSESGSLSGSKDSVREAEDGGGGGW